MQMILGITKLSWNTTSLTELNNRINFALCSSTFGWKKRYKKEKDDS